MGRRHVGTGFRRTALAALVSAGAVLAAFALPTAARALPGQDTAPPSSTGAATGFAAVVSVSPNAGSLSFAITSGNAIAETTGGLAQALAQSYDLGLIGSSLTAEGCDGSDAALTPEQLPQPTQVDNRHGDAAAESSEVPLATANLGSGLEQVAATTTPSSRAAVTSVAAVFDPVVSIHGGQATAEAEVLPGEGREARSGAVLDVEIAGLVTLTGMRWSAHHRTGSEPDAGATFEIGAIDVLGVSVPVESAEAAAAAVNAALAPLGFRIELPVVERITEPVDLIRVTPFRLLIDDSPAGAIVVRPALDLTRDLRSDLYEALTGAYCPLGGELLAAEIGIGVASGTGSLVVDLGGAEARSGEITYEDPFATDAVVPVAQPVGAGVAPVAITPPAAGVTLPASPASAVVPSATPVAAAPVAMEARCESTHPLRSPSCSRGAAAAVGIVGLLATSGVALVDLRARRRPRPVPEASA